MLYGYQRSQRCPDRRHLLGHGRELYFWCFVVALCFLRSAPAFRFLKASATE
jgi:divalent metal cation (Fe/Co/Zn/Cd) transporter